MDIAPLQRKVDATEITPERLAGSTQLTKQQKIAEASRQFEAVLLRQILEGGQKTVIKSKYGDNSASAAIYRDQVTTQLADSISKAGTFGFAQTFEQQLNRPAETNLVAPAHLNPIAAAHPQRAAAHPNSKTP